MEMKIKFKKRKGNVMIVFAIIAIIFPSILIIANMGGSSMKVIKSNENYHQNLLIEDSIKLVVKESVVNNLEIPRFDIIENKILIDGIWVVQGHYLPANTTVPLEHFFNSILTKQTLNTAFGMENITVDVTAYEFNGTSEDVTICNDKLNIVPKLLPFNSTLRIKGVVTALRDGEIYTYPLQLAIQFKVNSDIPNLKAYISEIKVTDINILND